VCTENHEWAAREKNALADDGCDTAAAGLCTLSCWSLQLKWIRQSIGTPAAELCEE